VDSVQTLFWQRMEKHVEYATIQYFQVQVPSTVKYHTVQYIQVQVAGTILYSTSRYKYLVPPIISQRRAIRL
jgi:hypothetical protein